VINLGKKNILGVLIDAVDYESAIQSILDAAVAGCELTVSALAVHGVMTGVLDKEHRYRLNSIDLAVPDGQPVRWALNWLYSTRLKDRVYGPSLALGVCERAAHLNIPVFFYGSRPEVLTALGHNLKEMFPKLTIAGVHPSFFRHTSDEEKVQVIDEIKQSGAKIVFVGLGCPRQEVWIYEYRRALAMPLLAVGAAFDFHAKTIPQAFPLMQNLGLEWLYRLMLEPKRLWKRYAILNPLYLYYLILQYFKVRVFEPTDTTVPTRDLNYG
jgi:N-acetylglucosaminyldiphosphoundecaprenol N-acetyl-beta-D-mannosaminyltransferase